MRSFGDETFLLRGAQIELSNRIPREKRHLHSNRPATAIPLLLKYKRENCKETLSYRPLSADNNHFQTEFSAPKIKAAQPLRSDQLPGSNSQITEESNLEKPFLPSSNILKSLLSDPVSARTLRNSDNIQQNLKPTYEEDKNFENYVQNEIMKQCALLPGLKTKPPLPSKNQVVEFPDYDPVQFSNYMKEPDGGLPTVLEEDVEQDNVEQFESDRISEKLFTNDVMIMNRLKNDTKPERSFRSETDENDATFDDIYLENFEEECDTPVRQSSRSVEKLEENSLKNWLEENRNLITHAKETEQQTDMFFQHLHKQVEMSEKLCPELESSAHIEPDSLDESDSIPHVDNDLKLKTLNLDLTEKNIKLDKTSKTPSGHVEIPKKKTTPKTSARQIISKPPPPKCTQKPTKNTQPIKEITSIEKRPKGILKNAPKKKCHKENKCIRNVSCSSRDDDIVCNEDEVKSYMSLKNTTSNYLDFLNKIDELENCNEESSCYSNKTEALRTTPERDGDNSTKSDVSTFDDIVSMLELLEREDLKSQRNIETMKEIVSEELSKDALGGSLQSSLQGSLQGSATNSTSSLVSSTNYNELLSYLDQVDESCRKNCQPTKQHAEYRVNTTNIVHVDKIPRVENLLGRSNLELSQSIVDLSLRLKEKASAVAVLQEELSKLRKVIQSNADECEKLLKQKLRVQKDDYEAIVKRHQKFIDQLIADKKSLNQQCESLISETKMLEDRYSSNIKAVEQRHKVELQKAKDMHAVAEKVRREKWMEMKTQKIKEMTAKSIEPEMQAMARRHQQDLSDLRAIHRRELEELELRAARATQQQCEALRRQLATDRDAAVAHERELVQQRFEKLVESEERSYQEQRRRLNVEHAARVAECESKEAAIIAEKERAIQAIRAEHEDRLDAAKRRHTNEMKNMKETMELELEAWKNNYRKQQGVRLAEMEAVLRESCKKDRDREIEMAIDRLEQEASESRQQIEQAAENRLRRMKEKYDEEMSELEKSEQEYKNKYNETKAKLLEYEETTSNLNNATKQLQAQLDETRQICNTLTAERNQVKDQIRSEFESEINTLQNELKILRGSKEQELQEVFTRVKLAVAKKDEVLEELRQDNTALQDKCMFLENLLEQQRKEYLINNKT